MVHRAVSNLELVEETQPGIVNILRSQSWVFLSFKLRDVTLVIGINTTNSDIF